MPPAPYGMDAYYDASAYDQGAASGPSLEEEALERALRSSLTPQDVRTAATRGDHSAYDGGDAGYGAGGYDTDRYLRALSAISGAYGTGGPPAGAVPFPDTQPDAGGAPRRPDAFLEAAAQSREGRVSYTTGDVQRPASGYEVREGTVVEALLLTAIHSDLPGEVLAQVARNVYDAQTQQTLLIPKGTRLIGTYNNQVALGQGRLLVAWTRMVFPDGRSVSLPGLASKDLRGRAGLTGKVNRHRLGAFGDALMLSALGAGLALSQRRPARDGSAYLSPGEVMAGSVAAELARVATETVHARAGQAPTIQIQEGTPFHVFLSGDLALPPYRAQDGFLQGTEWP